MPIEEIVLISYVPLVNKQGGAVLFEKEEALAVARQLDEMTIQAARGALWFLDEGRAGVALLVDRAKDLADHFKWWAGGKPEDWFRVHWLKVKKNGYALALMPDLEKTVERHKLSFQIQTGFPPPPDVRYKIYFKPLYVASPGTSGFDGARPHLKEKMPVYLIDTKFNDLPMEEAIKHTIQLGVFDVVEGGSAKSYLKNIMKDD